MIPHFAPPSVCVIDDDPKDYEPLLRALVHLGIGCMHVKGDSVEELPEKPFKGLRLIFMDLHLTGSGGKDAASHAANVFRYVVSRDPAPIVVVIWSKYKDDVLPTPITAELENTDASPTEELSEENELAAAAAELLPSENEHPTEADLFRAALEVAMEEAYERIVFLEMSKPKPDARPPEKQWIADLEAEIKRRLGEHRAFDVLWSWEALVREVGLSVSDDITKLATTWPVSGNSSPTLHDRLTSLLQLLAQTQGGPDGNAKTLPHHLLTLFAQLGEDQIERTPYRHKLDEHGEWLVESKQYRLDSLQKANLNTVLLTTPVDPSDTPFLPGTVYKFVGDSVPDQIPHFSIDKLKADCFDGKDHTTDAFKEFSANATPVFLELTPACDFHQRQRRSALLVAGLSFAEEHARKAANKEANKRLPLILDRSSDAQKVMVVVFCSRHRFTVDQQQDSAWLSPWFRLRDVLATDFRKWHAEHASRVGYLEFK